MNKVIVVMVGIAGILTCVHASQARHPFSVRDSIELTTFNEPSELEQEAKPIVSPDGKHLLVITTRGLIASDQIESTLSLYDTASIRAFVDASDRVSELKPRPLMTVVGAPIAYTLDAYSALITEPRWAVDSSRVYVLRQSATGDHELWEVDIKTKGIRRLTPRGYDVQKFALASHTVAATVSRTSVGQGEDPDSEGEEIINKDARIVSGQPLVKILFPRGTDRWQDVRDVELWVAQDDRAGRILRGPASQQIDTGVIDILSISPDGRRVARLLPVGSVADEWKTYESSSFMPRLRINPRSPESVSARNIMRLKSYAVLDLQTGKEVFRLKAPASDPLDFGNLDSAVWSADGQRLLMTNTFLPLDDVSGDERRRRVHSCLVADLALSSGDVHCVAYHADVTAKSHVSFRPPRLLSVDFGKDTGEVILRYRRGSGESSTERYRWQDEHWVLESSRSLGEVMPQQPANSEPGPNRLEVSLRQSLNSSPVLWGRDTSTGQARPLWDPNPQLAQTQMGEASVYRWRDADGVEWTGGLVKPIDYRPGKRYPLVIQTHGFANWMFKNVTDGAFPTAMAARPLASAGIMVLQIPDNRGDEMGTAAEAQRHVEGFRSAMAQLALDGLVDAKHVGVIGFSRTCWYVESALIKYPHLFAAATIVDGVDESYMQYQLFAQEAESLVDEFEQINQAKPVGIGLQKWLTAAPGFNLDRVETPLRIEAIGPRSVLLEWEIYSSLQQQGKAVDLIYMPGGQHILQRPLDRLASQQGNVDWFRFWLKDSNEGQTEHARYQRWETMRSHSQPAGAANRNSE